jgi:hypothetical protein
VALDLPWHAMLSGVETAEFFLFFYNKQLAYYLPKRLLDSTGINEIRTMMQNNIRDRARNSKSV